MNTARNGRRVPRWPRVVNTLEIAINGAAKIHDQDVKELLSAVDAAWKALREGVATRHQWSILAGSLDVAKAIERQGVMRGAFEHLNSADEALKSIYKRANTVDSWKPTALYFKELDDILAFISLHAQQVRSLSRSEFDQAINSAAGQIRSNGGRVTVIRHVLESAV